MTAPIQLHLFTTTRAEMLASRTHIPAGRPWRQRTHRYDRHNNPVRIRVVSCRPYDPADTRVRVIHTAIRMVTGVSVGNSRCIVHTVCRRLLMAIAVRAGVPANDVRRNTDRRTNVERHLRAHRTMYVAFDGYRRLTDTLDHEITACLRGLPYRRVDIATAIATAKLADARAW